MRFMNDKYDHKAVEKKWQAEWEKTGLYRAIENSSKPKKYVLDMFPYPSGEGLHVGHPKGYIATDVYSRMKRMQGLNVLHPMGWDAFGLPAEQYAIKNKVHPRIAVEKNVARFKEQLSLIGLDYDWNREVNTTDPEFYRWTQWTFLKMFEKGLAFESYEPINWCPTCLTGLANEDLDGDKCERCDTTIEQKPMRQWVLRITDYADRMLADLDKLDWPASIKESQRNWIGRSEGAEIDFAIVDMPQIKSYVMGVEDISAKLKDIGVTIVETTQDGDYKVIIPENSVKNYEELISSALKPGYWNEYVGQQTVFIFKDKDGVVRRFVLSSENSNEILKLCEKYANTTFGSVKTMLEGQAFYQKMRIGKVVVFTTRPDTLFGATYVVLAPEHKLIDELKDSITNWRDVEKYREEAKAQTEIERASEGREKTGVKLEGVTAVNPANGEELPVFVADYVLGHYGTGAVMAVPAHDERDYAFAKKFGLAIKNVVEPVTGVKRDNEEFRRSIVALVEDPQSGKILSLNWGNMGGNLLIGGGLDGEEDLVACAKREIEEETGYKNVEFVEQTEKIHHHYVAISKGVNREIEAVGLHFKLSNSEASEQSLEENEKGKFTVEWLSKNELNELIKDPLHKLVFDRFMNDKIYTDRGILFNSENFDGVDSEDAKKKITDFVKGRWATKYRLKDWVFSRQRYWGEPIPLIHCEKCGVVAVPEKDLPVMLPQVESYEPTGTGESPLANIAEWVNTPCPKCGEMGRRETNTMPQWAGSSWYYLRFIDPHNTSALVDKDKEKYWSPVDMYVGGAEHATRHLIYARFWHKFLYDIGVVNYEEPFMRLQNVGLIMAEDGRKMSKRWGNVVNPDDVVATHGADTLRLYEMFMGPFGQSVAWSTESIIGPRRFLERVWRLKEKIGVDSNKLDPTTHKTIKKVTEDIESFGFNTAISTLMILVNEMEKSEQVSREHYECLLKLLAPFAPHITEEVWHSIGNKESIHVSPWPVFDESKIVAHEATVAIQVNGKVRDTVVVPVGASEDVVKGMALARPLVVKWVDGGVIKKIIVVPGKIINIVVGE